MKKSWLKLLLIILIIALIINLTIFIPKQNQEKVKIGVIMPLTGFLANVGIDTKNAIDLSFSDLDASKDVELIYEDDACDSAKALTAYKKLVDVNKVNFIIGPFCGQSAMTILSSLNENKIITISPGAPDNELSKANDYFFRTRVPNKAETKKLIEFLNKEKIKKIAVYTAKNTFGQSYRDSLVNQLGNETKIVFEDGSSDYQTDFKTDILKIKEKNPQAVFLVPASRQQMGIFVKQLKELGFTPIILGGSVTEQQDLLDVAGNASEGIIYPYASPENLDIVKEYKEKYNKNPSMEVLNGYDAFSILYLAIKECKSDKECVRVKLNNLKDFNGTMGKISVDEFGDSQVELILKTIKNDQFIPYKD